MRLSTPRFTLTALLALGLLACKKQDDTTPAPAPLPSPLTFTVMTLAGSTNRGFVNGTGTNALFGAVYDVVLDAQGNLYVSDTGNNCIRKITPAGVVSTVAGTGFAGWYDGPGNLAMFNQPAGLAIDTQGTVYVSDAGNSLIRAINPAGEVHTIAGTGKRGYMDGPAATASFNLPEGITVDQQGNIYVADSDNNRIRKVSPQGVVSTVAGSGPVNGNATTFADGPASTATFYTPFGVDVDAKGNLYVADTNNNRIRKVSTAGVVSTVAGSTQDFANGPGAQAKFNFPLDVVVDSNNTLYVSDYGNGCIRRIGTDGQVSIAVGADKGFGEADGTGAAAQFTWLRGLAVSPTGTELYITDNYRIRKATGH